MGLPATRIDEREILLRAARLDAPAAEIDWSSVDWPRLVAMASRHRMIPLLHRHLSGAAIPPEAAAELAALNRAEAHRALELAAELRRLMAALAAAGVEALAYKGPALAVQAYGDLAARSFVDLDLLVPPDDAPRALGVLDAQGYARAMALTPARERAFRRVDGDYPLVHQARGHLVELHARVSTLRFAMPIDTDGLLRRAVSVRVGGGQVRTLGGDDLLLVLCVHGAKHRWKRLEWVAAVAALLCARGGKVAPVLAMASAVHARRTVLLGLSLVHRLLGAPVESDALREIAGDAGLAELAAEAEAVLFGDEIEGDDTAARMRFNLRARDGAMDRARSAGRWLFAPSPEDWGWVSLPDALFPLYRVLRPVRLLVRHGRGR
jgi:hypothetical protein